MHDETIPDDRAYSSEHVWAMTDGSEAVCGVSHYAQDQLGEVVYVGLPEPGTRFVAGECFGTVESLKSASELHMPVAGEVIRINERLEDQPDLVNQAPYGEGWIVRVRPDAEQPLAGLLDARGYAEFLSGLAGAEGCGL